MNHLHGSVIVTYRCNARCSMCGCFADPTKKEEEIGRRGASFSARGMEGSDVRRGPRFP